MPPDATSTIGIDHLDPPLAEDLHRSLSRGLKQGVLFERGETPDEIFRACVDQALRALERREHAGLVALFLEPGPKDTPRKPRPERTIGFMSDDQAATAVRFIHASVINAFKGALTELLAVGPVCTVVAEAAPRSRCLICAGDVVLTRRLRDSAFGKGADFHVLDRKPSDGLNSVSSLRGVVEVKSYSGPSAKFEPQLRSHLRRARAGLKLRGARVGLTKIRGSTLPLQPFRAIVLPATWRLPRKFWFEPSESGRVLRQEEPTPLASDAIRRTNGGLWQVTLRWSEEALTAAAYDMTFWYLGQVGKALFAERTPSDLEGMDPERFGRNRAKQSLHYAILRARNVRERSRAVALYNAYGFGYALGANFVDRLGVREVLFPEDLDEIARTGRCRTEPVVFERHGRTVRLPPPNCRIV